MPDPREAIYDVLKAKWERAQDLAALEQRAQEIENWNLANQRARSAAHTPSRT